MSRVRLPTPASRTRLSRRRTYKPARARHGGPSPVPHNRIHGFDQVGSYLAETHSPHPEVLPTPRVRTGNCHADGRDVDLGPYGTAVSRREYDRVIAEWLTNGRRTPFDAAADQTVVELIAAYCLHAQSY